MDAREPQKRIQGALFARHILRKVFLEDWHLKLIALAITIGLWLGVTGFRKPITTPFRDVGLRIWTSPNMVASPEIVQVNLAVSGDARDINQISSQGIGASIDLSAMEAGEKTVILSPANVNLNLPAGVSSTGVKLMDISPNKIVIKLEALQEKRVTVTADTTGSLAPNFEIYSTAITPASVQVRGPESVIKGLDSISTEKIDIAGRSTDFAARQIQVLPANPKMTIQDGAVDVKFRIGERRVEKTLTSVTNTGKKVRFTVFGPKSLLEKSKSDDFRVIVGDDSPPQVIPPVGLVDVVQIRNIKVSP